MAKNWTVSGSVDSELWNWIERTRGDTPRRAFVTKCIEFYKKNLEGEV